MTTTGAHRGAGVRVHPMRGRGSHGDYSTATIREGLQAMWELKGIFVPAKREVSK